VKDNFILKPSKFFLGQLDKEYKDLEKYLKKTLKELGV